MRQQCLKKTLWLLLALFAFISFALGAIDSGLKTSATPHGIVSFEFCAFTSSCEQALSQWGPGGQALAMLSLGLDYLYLLVYPGLMALALLLVAPRVPFGLMRRTRLAAWSCLAIGLADALENYALIRVILDESGDGCGVWAGLFATIKFALLGLVLLWLVRIVVQYALPGDSNST